MPRSNVKFNILALTLALVGLGSQPGFSLPKPEWSFGGGGNAGYSLGQNGEPWPELSDPWKNSNRGGFYLGWLLLSTTAKLDSSLRIHSLVQLKGTDFWDAYLQKDWDKWSLRFGRFRGAGLKTGSGSAELEDVAMQRPMYAYVWNGNNRIHHFRDYGIETEYRAKRSVHRIFLHNANGQNVETPQPAWRQSDPVQVLGLDYAWEWEAGPYSAVGGHVGVMGSREWQDFIGEQDWWKIQYWFKSNTMANVSLFHQLKLQRLQMLSELWLMDNRDIQVQPNLENRKSWAASSLVHFTQNSKWQPYLRYEIYDFNQEPGSGEDGQLITGGIHWFPLEEHPSLRLAGEYCRAVEAAGENSVANDSFILRLQYRF